MKKQLIFHECLICHKQVKSTLSREKKGQDKFCSRKCFFKSRSINGVPWLKKFEYNKRHESWLKGKKGICCNTGRTHFPKGHIPWTKGKKFPELSEKLKGKSLPKLAIERAKIKNIGNKYRKGKYHTDETKEKISKSRKGKMMGENNFKWKGNNVGYNALHTWLSRILGKPKKCYLCKTEIDQRYHWANISKQYKRDLSDWIRLCPKCHYHFDRKGEYIYA